MTDGIRSLAPSASRDRDPNQWTSAIAAPTLLMRPTDRQPAAAAAPPSPSNPLDTLLDALSSLALLDAKQSAELAQTLAPRFREPAALLTELTARQWLTAFQADRLREGRGSELVLGPYVLLEQLGEGATGRVFKARHQKFKRLVALKVIRQELLADAEIVSRFYREVRVASQLTHPNVVHAFDAGPIGSAHVLVMEYLEGTDLNQRVRQRGPLPLDEARQYIRQAALGMQHAQECGLVHRDLKPSNLYLCSGAQGAVVKVLDFGLARLAWKATPGDAATVVTNYDTPLMGTPDYLAPEQALDFHAADIRADIYSLGCTFYFLLTGQPPFPGGGITEKLARHLNATPPGVEQLRPDVPPALAAVVSRMLAKSPEQRFQTPGEVAAVLGGVGPLASPRRKGRRLGVACGLAGVLLGGLLLLNLFGARTPEETARPAAPSTKSSEASPPEIARHHPLRLLREWKFPQVSSLCFCPENAGGNVLAAGGADETVRVWNVSDGQERSSLSAPGIGKVQGLLFAPDGKRLMAFSLNADPRWWDLPNGPTRVTTLPPELKHIWAIGSNPDQRKGLLATESSVYRWDWSGQMALMPATRFNDPVGPQPRLWSAFWALGKEVVTASDDRKLRVLPIGTSKKPRESQARKAAFLTLTVSPDGKKAATGSSEGAIIWDLATMRELCVLETAQEVHGVAFSASGKTLATVTKNGSVQLWSVAAGKERAGLPVDKEGETVIAFSADGGLLAVGGSDGVVRLWEHPLASEK